MANVTAEDRDAEEFGLDLAENHLGLDRKNNDGCLKVINESRTRIRKEGCNYFTEEGIKSLKIHGS